MSIINYMTDTIEAITDQICHRVYSIPIVMRIFCKAIYDLNLKRGNNQMECVRQIANFVIEQWLAQVAFKDNVIYGLIKSYYIK